MDNNQKIFNHLKDRLINGSFEPGVRVRSAELAEGYNVSANTVREMLFRLSAIGLVDFLEQRGFRIPKKSATLLHDLTQNRIWLESEGAALSIRYGGVAWEAQLNAAHHELKYIERKVRSCDKSGELLSLWTAAELKFHRTLIAECQSELLQELHLQVYQRFRQQLITCDRRFVFIPANVEQHHAILEAVLLRDETSVRQQIHNHLKRHLIKPGIDQRVSLVS